jgi:hypothetical protein
MPEAEPRGEERARSVRRESDGSDDAATTSDDIDMADPAQHGPAGEATQREGVQRIVQEVARDARAVHDDVSFARLVRSLDERVTEVLRLFGRT